MRKFYICLFVLLASWSRPWGMGNKITQASKEHLANQGKGKFVKYGKNGVRSVVDKIPGGKFISDLIFDGGDSLEDKVERIDQNQKTSLSKLRALSKKVLSSTRKIEDLWYYKSRSIHQGKLLADRLRGAKPKKLLVAGIESWLEIPINPAAYIPNIPQAQKLKSSFDYDLSLESAAVKETRWLLSNTRAALVASGLDINNPAFKRKWEEAEENEALLREAMHAKQIALVKIYKEEIERLGEQIKVLEKAQSEEGLDESKVMQMEMVKDNKRRLQIKLSKQVDKAIQQSLDLSKKQRREVAVKTIADELTKLEEKFQEERRNGRPLPASSRGMKAKTNSKSKRQIKS